MILMLQRILIILGWIAVVVGIAIITLINFWLLYPYEPIVFNGGDFKVIPNRVIAGHSLSYQTDFCKYTDETAVVSRSFVNGIIFVTPPTTTGRPRGCHVVNIDVHIPEELPPGIYHLENIYTYRVNPIRTVSIKHNTEPFIVVGDEKGDIL